MLRASIIAGLVSLTIDAAACAGHKSAAVPPPEPVVVIVNNSNYLDVDVFAVRGTSRARVGSVTGLSSATFNVPAHFTDHGSLQLLQRSLQGGHVRLNVGRRGSLDGLKVELDAVERRLDP